MSEVLIDIMEIKLVANLEPYKIIALQVKEE